MAAKTRTKRAAPVGPPPERVALTVPEVAAMLGCSERTVWTLLATEKLPRVRLGASVRIHRAAVERFLEAGGTEPSKAV